MRNVRWSSLIPAVTALTLGCSGSTSPADDPSSIAGTYVLALVNGEPVPGITHEDKEVQSMITKGTLTLRPDGTFTEVVSVLDVYPTKAARGFNQLVDNGTYSLSEGRVTFSVPADGGLPGHSYTGTFNPGNIRYQTTFQGGQLTLEYAR